MGGCNPDEPAVFAGRKAPAPSVGDAALRGFGMRHSINNGLESNTRHSSVVAEVLDQFSARSNLLEKVANQIAIITGHNIQSDHHILRTVDFSFGGFGDSTTSLKVISTLQASVLLLLTRSCTVLYCFLIHSSITSMSLTPDSGTVVAALYWNGGGGWIR